MGAALANARRRAARLLGVLVVALAPVAGATVAAEQGGGVLTYHNNADRSGLYIVPGLDWERARRIHLDPNFHPAISGHLYAQPLFWMPQGATSGRLIVATEDNEVSALDAATGKALWRQRLGPPVPSAALPCGNIDPLGVTGTPVIDPVAGALYLDAVIGLADGPHHRIFALSLANGATLPGWPVDVAGALGGQGLEFRARDQNQRGALTILAGRVFVPFGGHFGDCGVYHGWVVGVALGNPGDMIAWSTRGRGGGIWAPGGIGSDGHSLFVATGNTIGASVWQDGEAVIRLRPELRHAERRQDFFAPRDWRALDARDADLGGSNPLSLDVPTEHGSQPLVLALGKDRNAYLLDRDDLGGIGGALVQQAVAEAPIRTAAAAWPARDGLAVAFEGPGSHCPKPGQLTVLKIGAGSPPRITTAWCGAFSGAGAAIVTTTDGTADPIVWIVGAEGDNRLHGFRGDTGEPLFAGGGVGDAMSGLRHFQTLLAAAGRLYVGADGRLYAFAY